MLIFDNFPTTEKARQFSDYVWTEFKRKAVLCEDRQTMDHYEIFPFGVDLPVVLVERMDGDYKAGIQSGITDSVEKFGGTFAGT